jgi:hypothetical protein
MDNSILKPAKVCVFCMLVSDLWHELNRWIFEMTYIEIPLNLEIVMFGLLHPYDANLIKNKIILLTKFYIFRTPSSMEFQCMSFQKSICSIHAISLKLYDTPIVDVQ